MKYKQLIPALLYVILMTSCINQKYYQKVAINAGEFTGMVNYINQKRILSSKDTLILKNGLKINLDNACVYFESVKDSTLKLFMLKYQLKRICFTKADNAYFDSVITFHKEYTPFIGKAVVVAYDFGKSYLRTQIINGNKPKNEVVKIIDSFYLYRVRPKPAFGE